jgi:hypothetical protein
MQSRGGPDNAALAHSGDEGPNRRPVAPHFVVAIVNDTTILRCVLSSGAATIVSDVARLPAHQPAGGNVPHGFLRVLLYSPNLVTDDYPSFAWDADLLVDNTVFFVGSVRRRCDVIEKRFILPEVPRVVQLRLHRLRLAPVRSQESETLALKLLQLMQDPSFNPRVGSMPLKDTAEEMHKRYADEYRAVIGGEHLGSFRAFISAHSTRFSIFHYHQSEIDSRRMPNVTPYDERVAIRKGVRDSMPPMMTFAENKEQEMVNLLVDALRERDSHVHVLMRELSAHEEFRVGMASGFSSLMHFLHNHRDVFCWSTDPQAVCTIGLVRDRAPGDPVLALKGRADEPDGAAADYDEGPDDYDDGRGDFPDHRSGDSSDRDLSTPTDGGKAAQQQQAAGERGAPPGGGGNRRR